YGSTQVLLSGSGSTLVETSAARDRRHIYNRRNQIVATYINFQLTGTYAYNALGQRTHKMTPSTDAAEDPIHTVYHYGLSGQLMAETRIDSQTGKETHKNYLWMNRVPVAMTMTDDSKGQQITYLHTDHLNTPRKATNDQQTIVWQWQSDAFGMGLVNPDPDGDGKDTEINLRFAGQYYDHESGLFYNYHRYYDPETGRYSQSDPIGLRGGINTYAYVNSNPLVSTDPLGLFLFAFDGTGMDRDNIKEGQTLTNVALFQNYYEDTYGDGSSFYLRGVGTDGGADTGLGGIFGKGARSRVDDALERVDTLIREGDPFFSDGIIDIVGFSRGAAIAREFSNDVYERIDSGYYDNLYTKQSPDRDLCSPLPTVKIRFMGIFDTVGSLGEPGDSDNGDFDLTTDPRIEHVAHAVALNEHRSFFSLSSVERDEHNAGSDNNIVEQGFIGAHTDVGGGYANGDLSDAPLQWMLKQAERAQLQLVPLKKEHELIDKPVLHDERTGDEGFIYPNNGDRKIFYENDPDWEEAFCKRPYKGGCVGWLPSVTQRQKTAPQFPKLDHMLIENPDGNQGNIRGTVDMVEYQKWLKENLSLNIDLPKGA
ncbi:phospholipase effector Tle1 domain-containing protein, partial [Endozoicomonas sp. ALE010]|uniref:phospholipase effector Tle1 domain-containing protein n=1 Tax=Endozoicomonas sp. ALE010 TaxID=3403081 RepID=UPI003BB6C5F4